MTIRYGEILLIYAEALNELTSGQVYHLTTYTGADVEIQRSVDAVSYTHLDVYKRQRFARRSKIQSARMCDGLSGQLGLCG